MQLGMVGLGRMGSGMTKRLEEHGHEVKTYDPKVASTAKTLGALCKQLAPPRHVWLMIPAGEITEKAFQQLLEVHPFWQNAKQAVDELEREVEGQGI